MKLMQFMDFKLRCACGASSSLCGIGSPEEAEARFLEKGWRVTDASGEHKCVCPNCAKRIRESANG